VDLFDTFAELEAEARRCREHAANVAEVNPDGARQALVRAERIERAMPSAHRHDSGTCNCPAVQRSTPTTED
jgi:hypothetical protein